MPVRSKVLVVRNDKLGDFVLALPSFALIKQQWPEAEVVALVPEYTRPIAELCPWIDRVFVDPGERRTRDLRRALRRERFDAVLTLFSTTRVGWAVFAARIPYRLAPATKFAQIFYNRRLVQRRSRSEKPEYAYNLDLARRLLVDHGAPGSAASPERPYLAVDRVRVMEMRRAFMRQHGVDPAQRLVFVHPGSGGSANNLTVEQYARLVRGLTSAPPGHRVVISAGPAETALAERLGALLADVPHVIYRSTEGLRPFVETLAFSDVFVSGSTGPLHLAGALDRPTVGFYPRRRSSTPLRWQTLSSEGRRLAYCPPEDAEDHDMSRIDLTRAAAEISERFLGHQGAPPH